MQGLYMLGATYIPAPPIPWWQSPPGSLVRRKDLYIATVWHYGVIYDPWRVLHIDKDQASGRIRLKWDTFADFAAGREVYVDHRAEGCGVPVRVLHQRACELAQRSPAFGLLSLGETWNCEDVARYIGLGAKQSQQAETAVTAGLALAVFGFFLAVANDS